MHDETPKPYANAPDNVLPSGARPFPALAGAGPYTGALPRLVASAVGAARRRGLSSPAALAVAGGLAGAARRSLGRKAAPEPVLLQRVEPGDTTKQF